MRCLGDKTNKIKQKYSDSPYWQLQQNTEDSEDFQCQLGCLIDCCNLNQDTLAYDRKTIDLASSQSCSGSGRDAQGWSKCLFE